MPHRGVPHLLIGAPRLPSRPSDAPPDTRRFIDQLVTELDIHFSRMRNAMTDIRGFLQTSSQILNDGFTIVPDANYVDLRSATGGTVTSNATAAIAAGVLGQGLVLTNTGTGNIVIKHNAQTWLTPLADVTLTYLTAIFLRWDNATRIWAQIKTL